MPRPSQSCRRGAVKGGQHAAQRVLVPACSALTQRTAGAGNSWHPRPAHLVAAVDHLSHEGAAHSGAAVQGQVPVGRGEGEWGSG